MRGVLVLSLIFLIPILSFSQPGPSGGILGIKIFKDGKRVELPNEQWQIIPNHIELADSTFNPSAFYFHKDSSIYYIVPKQTPVGGSVDNDFYLDIVFNHDTMTIVPPLFRHDDVILDSIPFQKGFFKIPQSVYDFRGISKTGTYYGKAAVPNLYGDWSLFTHETYKCYIEKVEDLDAVPNDNAYYENRVTDYRYNWPSLSLEKSSISYYFNNDVIVAHSYATGTTHVYEVKSFSDQPYFRFQQRPSVRSIYSKGNDVYAVIYKNSDNCGVFKLHFVEEEIPAELNYLQKKQIIEEYEAELKGLRFYDQLYRDREAKILEIKFQDILDRYGVR